MILVFTGILAAQGQLTHMVVPAGFDNVESSAATTVGFVPFNQRLIEIYLASELGIPAGRSVWIHGVAFRQDGRYWGGSRSFEGVFPEVSVSLSTTPRSPEAISLIFQQNLGPDLSNVYHGPLPIVATNVSQNPNPFDVRIPFATPFKYDPSRGNLAFMLETVGGRGSLLLDAYGWPGSGPVRAGFVFGPLAQTNGIQALTFGHIIQLSIELENTAPIAHGGPNQVRECFGEAMLIHLNGSSSWDPDGDPLAYEWSFQGQSFSTNAIADVPLPGGQHTFTLVVTDPGGLTSTSTVQVAIMDQAAPDLTNLVANPAVLWPPGRRMVPVVISAEALDICDPAPRLEIVSVTSNKPSSPDGDWEITGPLTLNLRAERQGRNGARIYTVMVAATDSSSNTTLRAVQVSVPLQPPSPPTVTVRALKRLIFEIPRWVTPAGGREPVTFVFRRSGDTNESLTVHFALSGTARVDEDYARWEYLEPYNPGTIITGAVQSVVFNPGERLRHVYFLVTQDEIREPAEMVRLRLLPSPDGASPYQPGGRRCATVWALHQYPCARIIPTPGGSQTCVGHRPFILPRAFFATEVCR